MKVEELIIDGFKSYATRTIISNWDTQFNCITGLNGSGKSNILDAICFVLGITSMSTVRAQNLQDLIYKRGQAGVTKASVTIVFDNSDKDKSPVGFESQPRISVTRQIVMGGTSKYLIDGHRAQQQTVQQLFQSVQLNINNPNFLIMQGRITKVLNMKPVEVLALIEEAAGTRMFEDRREKAIKTMAKKEKKREEIDDLLATEIKPKLDELRGEKRQFIEYQKLQTELDRATKLVVSHDYDYINTRLERQTETLNSKTSHLHALQALVPKSELEIKNLNRQITELKDKKAEELRSGSDGEGSFAALEQKCKDLSQELARLKTLEDLTDTNLKQARQKFSKLSATLTDLQSSVSSRFNVLAALEKDYNDAKAEFQVASKEKEKKEELLQSLQIGVASKEGQESGYNNEIQQVRRSMATAHTSKAKNEARLESLHHEIERDRPKVAKAQEQIEHFKAELVESKNQLEVLSAKMVKSGFVPERLSGLQSAEHEMTTNLRELTHKIDSAKKRFSNIDFKYNPPADPNFNPSSVKGLVAQLFTLDEKNYDAATALEVCAGGKLYQVVVDSDTTASQILKHGGLRHRVTIIPLNKVTSPGFQRVAEKLGVARKIAPGKVNLALDLVGYKKDVEKAMQYVFGSTLVCADSDAARAVAFNPNVRVTTVTLDGDVYDPNGTLSGGSQRNGGRGAVNVNSDEIGPNDGLLISLQKINRMAERQKTLRGELEELKRHIHEETALAGQCRALKKDYDLKQHEVSLTEKKLHEGPAARVLQQAVDREAQVENLQRDIAQADQTVTEGVSEIERIEQEMKEFEGNKSGKLEELQALVAGLQKRAAEKLIRVQDKQKRLQGAQVENEESSGDLESITEERDAVQKSIQEFETELKGIEKQVVQVSQHEQEIKDRLEAEKTRLIGLDEELGALEKTLTVKSKFLAENSRKIQTMTHEVEKIAEEVNGLQARRDRLLSEFDWISAECANFGKAGTDYNYHAVTDIAVLREELKRLEQRWQGMKNTVNPKVMNMIDNMEKKESDLEKMIETIKRDKCKIEETIVQLDDYKKKALEKTWTKVSQDLGKIFGELLPGNSSKLVAPEGKEITDGLEVKVQLGGVWKESLTELSGGQRSLVALALILALLQFKPAPMYILDEVDAALDLNHTQNIGQLIKTRFHGSQFIVVSLKEGMFTNANRVFRTRFTDGTSTVTVS